MEPRPSEADFTGEPVPPAAPEQPLQIGNIFDPARARENMRGWIAIGLLALFALEICIALLLLGLREVTVDDLAKIAAVLLSPVVTLLGAVTGFYYGSSAGEGNGVRKR